jgi:hypothetical protein
MKALSEFSRSERITGVAGILLLIGLFAFPWYHVGVAAVTIAGQTYGGASYNGNALSGPGSFFSVVALIVLIALLAELAISRFTTAELPKLPISWGGNFGWGFYADMVLAIALIYGAVGLRRSNAARATGTTAASQGY